VLDRDVRQVADLMTKYRTHFGDAVPEQIREVEERIDLGYTLENLDRLLRSTRQGIQRVGEIVGGLRDFSRLDEATSKQVDPNEAVRVTVEMVRFHVRHKGVELTVDTTPLPLIWCNAGQINQVLLNLIMNAIQAVDPGATIWVRTRSLPGSNEIQYEVADNGPGIPESLRGKIFDPFFTTKPQGVGTGLGLWITYNIVEQHGGRIDLATEPGVGTTFTITLPVRKPDDPAPTAVRPAPD
jgi:signal transduction histidine kinase